MAYLTSRQALKRYSRNLGFAKGLQSDSEARHHEPVSDTAYRSGPTAPIPFLGDLELDTGEPSKVDEAVEVHKDRMRSGVEERWKQLLALEQVVSEVRVKFDGEDPALPVLRDVLDRSRERMEELHGETERYTGPFDLPEPGDGEVAWVRELAERQQA